MNHIWRFFCETSELKLGHTFLLNESEQHYAFHVLRLAANEMIELTDGAGHVATAKITAIGKNKAEVCVQNIEFRKRPAHRVIVNLGMPKPSTLDEIVPTLAELAVTDLNIIITERAPTKAVPQLEKLNKQARNALRINKLAWAPNIHVFKNLDEFLKIDLSDCANFLCDESPLHESGKSLYPHLAVALENTKLKNISVCIGPESSFTEVERQKVLRFCNHQSVLLGDAILRVPTAAMMAASIVLGHLAKQN